MSKRRKKKTVRQKLKDELEQLVKDFVRRRDNYTCRRCGRQVYGTNCHCSHVVPVSACGRLEFDPANMIVMCYHDHINWWHKHPIESGKWFLTNWPQTAEYLHIQQRLHNGSGTIPLTWFEERIKIYQIGVSQEGTARLARRGA